MSKDSPEDPRLHRRPRESQDCDTNRTMTGLRSVRKRLHSREWHTAELTDHWYRKELVCLDNEVGQAKDGHVRLHWISDSTIFINGG